MMKRKVKRMSNFIIEMSKRTKNMLEDRIFLSKTASIAFPVAFQSMLNMVINLADTLMIGRLGENSIAAVGLGNKIFFVYILFVFGASSAIGMLSAQYYGNNDIKNIRKVLGMGLLVALSASFVFTGATLLNPEFLMRIFTKSDTTVKIGMLYLGTVGISYPFTAISNIYTASVRSMGEVKIPVITSIVTIIINISLNYVFIFGVAGFPAMGVAGAALATVIARVSETLLILGILSFKKHPVICRLEQMFFYSKELMAQFVKTSLPVIANEFFWGLGFTLYSVAYGRMGDAAVASITIATSLQDLLQIGINGIGAATVTVLGYEMGANNLKRAKTYASYFYILSLILSLIMAVLTVFIREPFVSLYEVSEEVKKDVMLCLLVFAFYLPFKFIGILNVIGVLRSGGDTLVCFFIDVSSVWFLGVPFAFLGAFIWKLPIYYVYALVTTEEIYKTVFGYLRYKQYKWLRNLNLDLQKGK